MSDNALTAFRFTLSAAFAVFLIIMEYVKGYSLPDWLWGIVFYYSGILNKETIARVLETWASRR